MPAKSTERDGESVLQVETPFWEAEIVLTVNANMTKLRCRRTGLELLRSPETLEELRKRPERYGIPILFPPNRISGGEFSWNGRTYRLPINEEGRENHIHGLALGMPFALKRIHESGEGLLVETSFQFGPEDPRFPGYPHRFLLSMSYAFKEERVVHEVSIRNLSEEPMPLGLGFHTAFRLPFGGGEGKGARLMATAGKGYWELSPETRIPTGDLHPWPERELFREGRALDGEPLARLFPLEKGELEGRAFSGAVIESPEDGARLLYEFDDSFKHCAVWNDGGGKGFLCVEPMTWMTDAPKLPLPPLTTGFQSLPPGKSWKAMTSFKLTSIDTR